MSLADKVTTGTYNFVSLIVKIILSSLALVLSLPGNPIVSPFKFSFYFELINGISSDL